MLSSHNRRCCSPIWIAEPYGSPNSRRSKHRASCAVRQSGTSPINVLQVTAVAYDNPIPGYGTNNTINLRLWAAKPDTEFDLEAFNTGDYVQVCIQKNSAPSTNDPELWCHTSHSNENCCSDPWWRLRFMADRKSQWGKDSLSLVHQVCVLLPNARGLR